MVRIFLTNINIRAHKGILDSSKDDFEDGDEVYEAIGEVLHEVAEKPENEVRSVNVFALITFYNVVNYPLLLSFILCLTL